MTKVIIILGIFLLAFFVLAMKSLLLWKRQRKLYSNIQSERALLTDEAFCQKMGIDVSSARVVSNLRSAISRLGKYDPLRVYPDDTFYHHFGLDYDDDVASLLQSTKIIDGYKDDSFPLEEVKTVGDFVKVVLRLKKQTEEAKIFTGLAASV